MISDELLQLNVDIELQNICREILQMNKCDDEWAEIESCDMFQTSNYCGGYVVEEQAFWFSYFDAHQKEWWFELRTEQLIPVLEGELLHLDLKEPL